MHSAASNLLLLGYGDPGLVRLGHGTLETTILQCHKCFLLLFAVAALHDKLYWRQYLRQFNKLF